MLVLIKIKIQNTPRLKLVWTSELEAVREILCRAYGVPYHNKTIRRLFYWNKGSQSSKTSKRTVRKNVRLLRMTKQRKKVKRSLPHINGLSN